VKAGASDAGRAGFREPVSVPGFPAGGCEAPEPCSGEADGIADDRESRRAEIRVGEADDGTPLLSFLTNRFRYLDAAEWTAAIREGRLRVNGTTAEAEAALRAGDRVEFRMDDLPEPPVRTDYRVVFRDGHLLAVDKPGNLPCHPGGRYFRHTLWHLLRRDEGLEAPRFLHRLDRETSGLVLVARTADAARAGQRLFVGGAIRKIYQVLVEGRFPAGTVRAEGRLAADAASPIRKRRRFIPRDSVHPESLPVADAQGCRTRFRRIAATESLSLLAAVPETGRSHQIRATLHALGFPVTGDKVYGVDETLFLRFIEDRLTAEDRTRLRLPRQALHAAGLDFPHPIAGRPIRLRSALPAEIHSLLG
jgi:RluA family pseudouridine synthase